MTKNRKKDYFLYEVEPFHNFKESLELSAQREGNKPAFMFKKENGEIEEVSFAAFKTETEALGTGLASIDGAECHAAIVSENSYKWITAFLTMLNGKGVAVPVDKELPADEIANVINHSDSEIVFFSKKYEDKIKSIAGVITKVRYFIGFDLEQDSGNFLSYEKLKSEGYKKLKDGDTSYTSAEPEYEKLKLLVYTSGTTGTPKGVMLSLKNIVSCVYYGLKVSTVYTRCLSVLPYNHTYESVCGILVSLHHGSTLCINENLRSVAKNLKLYKPDFILLVPLFVESMYKKIWAEIEAKGKAGLMKKMIKTSNALLKVGIDMRPVFFKSIRDVFGGNMIKIVCGGAPIREELGEFFEAIGIRLCNGYGITECSPLVAGNRDYFYNFSSVGVKLPCVDIKIFEPNEDGEGEICVKGDTVMLGYYKQKELTSEVLEEDGWFHTGDYGRMDDKKRLYITGRKKNIIVLKNGKNVYPEEIEDYIMALPLVSEVIVSAVKNENGEEIGLLAEILPNAETTKDMTQEEIMAKTKEAISKVNERLPAYKQVNKVILRKEAFTKTSTGKIRRQYTK